MMALNTLTQTSGKSGGRLFWLTAGCLALLLVLQFSASFRPGLALFSQDAPLGVISAQAEWALSNFKGVWLHLNWIGEKSFSSPPNITNTLFLLLGAVGFSKFYAPISLLVLGLSAWLLFRQMGFRPWVCLLGALAMALNTDPFSYACWGLASLPLAMSGYLLALAALARFPGRYGWIRAALAGSAVGLSIMEGFDNGAIFSLYVAAFALFQSFQSQGSAGQRLGLGSARVAVVALIAGLTAAHTLATLFGTQVQGVAIMAERPDNAQRRWDFATQWSLPKIEALRTIIPGLFGYRLDTPDGGNYWGAVGRTPGWEQHRQGLPRHSGAGHYAGVLVAFVAFWACVQSLRGPKSVFEARDRRFIWFWAGAAVLSLFLSFGRHAPLYQLIYPLPFFSSMRNPVKFLHPMSVALVILFAYGLEGLARGYIGTLKRTSESLSAHLKTWWKHAPAFDRKWALGSAAFLGASALAWLIYASSKPQLEQFIQNAALPAELAPSIAKFSILEVGWYVLFLLLSTALILLVTSGWFSGARTGLPALLLGLVLVADLWRANTPWIQYYDYEERYASNQVIDLLRDQPHEHRVVGRLIPRGSGAYASNEPIFQGIYETWLQHHFQYYKIQSLDITQMPRMPRLDEVFAETFQPTSTNQFPLVGRLWQLTNTRYILGSVSSLEFLNNSLDPVHRRFRIHTPFDFAPTPKAPATGPTRIEEITAVIRPEGRFALLEFSGALGRATLFSNWEISASDDAALKRLADPAFDPTQTVLVCGENTVPPASAATNQSPGSAEIVGYAPKEVNLKARVTAPSILLLSDRHASDWRVYVDGKPEPLLRLNYLMRGVYLQPGDHTVQFRFEPPVATLYVSLAAIGISFLLCGILAFRQTPAPDSDASPAPPSPKASAAKSS